MRHCSQLGKLVVHPHEPLPTPPPSAAGGGWHSRVLACGAAPGGWRLFAYACCCPCLAAGEVAAAAQQGYYASCACALLALPCGGACFRGAVAAGKKEACACAKRMETKA